MFFIDFFGFVVVVVVVLVILAFRRRSEQGQAGSSQSAGISYDYGYWAGRQSLRDELRQLIQDRETVSAADISAIIEANQWSPPDVSQDTPRPVHAAAPGEPGSEAPAVVPADYSAGLLYLGAFLFIAAASLFVLLSGVGGGIKTLSVIFVSALFYVVGVLLSRRTQRLAGVGMAFAAIGLMLAPLTGVAAYGYLLGQSHGAAVWLVTSIGCLILYVHALFVLQKDYISYLCIGMLISLVESIGFQSGLSMYYLAWGLILASALSGVLHSFMRHSFELRLSRQFDLPVQLTAYAVVPVALLWSLALVIEHGILQFILSLFFVGAYYALYGYWQGSGTVRQICWLAAQVLLLFAGGLFAYHVIAERAVVATYLAVSTSAYVAASISRFIHQLYPRHHEGVYSISILLLFALLGSVIIWPHLLLLTVAASLGMFYLQWRSRHGDESMVMFQLALLSMPALLGGAVVQPPLWAGWIAVMYTILAFGLMIAAYFVKAGTIVLRNILITSYSTAITVAFFIACFVGPALTAGVMLCGAILIYNAAYRHGSPHTTLAGHALLYASAGVLSFTYSPQQVIVLLLLWLSISLALYLLSFFGLGKESSQTARIGSFTGSLVTGYASLAQGEYWHIAPFALVAAAGIAAFEAYSRRVYWLYEVAAAICLFALQIVLYKFGVTELLVYSHSWAALALVLAVFRARRGEGQQSDAFVWGFLSAATIPFALMLLNPTLGVGYGWLFIAQHTALVIIGAVLRRSNIIWWSLVATMLAVLYQMRELQFVALGLLSLFVLGIAAWLSLRRQV